MKIAFIVPEFPSISQTFILNQITGLIDRGHVVDIFAKKYNDQKIYHEEIRKYNLLNHTSYFQHLPLNKVIRVKKGFKFIFENIKSKNFKFLKSINFIYNGKNALSLNLLFESIPFIDKGPYDIIHCHFGPCGIIGADLKLAGIINGKLITSFHAYDLNCNILKKYKKHYRKLFQIGDLFQPVSNHWKRKLIKLGCNENKISIHRMGIDIQKFSFKKFCDISKIRFLSVARLVEKKGIEYGIKAFAETKKTYPNIEYFIVGDGPLKSNLLNLINRLKVHKSVQILDWLTQSEILELMDKCTILLAPSVTDEKGEKEGIPVVMMEAMAKGLPVISTYHSGIPELVKNEQTGFLVNERDIKGLVKKMGCFIVNPNIIKDIALKGRKFIEENHDISVLNNKLLITYQNLINK